MTPHDGKTEPAPRVWDDAWTLSPATLVGPWTELHWAVQYIAGAGQTFVEHRDDDSHRAMTWNVDQRAFVGMPFAGPYPFRVAVRPEDLSLLLVSRTGEALGTFPLAGRALSEGFEWLSIGMATYLGGMPPLIERPEYDMPAHPVGDGKPFRADRPDALRFIGALYGGAAALVQAVLGPRGGVAGIRCWPHHFDIAALLDFGTSPDGGRKRTVGVGLAPGGHGRKSWYLYVAPRPAPADGALPAVAEPALWHTEGWTGIVLDGLAIGEMPPEERAERVVDALAKALDVAIAPWKD